MGYWKSTETGRKFYFIEDVLSDWEQRELEGGLNIEPWLDEHYTASEIYTMLFGHDSESIIQDLDREYLDDVSDLYRETAGRGEDLIIYGTMYDWVDDDNPSYNRKPKTMRKPLVKKLATNRTATKRRK